VKPTVHPIGAKFKNEYTNASMGRESVVDIATRYGLIGPGIESRWGQNFPYASRLAVKSTQPRIQWVTVLSQGEEAGTPTHIKHRG
jgi:hypothetical protein